ncbi:MAG TPA: integrin alpha [bacterium]|nr:integrin alpha [bacterium]
MTRITAVILMLTGFIFFSCSNNSTKSKDDPEISDDTTDIATDENTDETDDDFSDEVLAESEENDFDTVEPQQLQTGGIVVYDDGGSTNPEGHTLLGQGGFFGYSVFRLNEEFWAVSAIHESVPPYDFEKATGALYYMGLIKLVPGIQLSYFRKITHPEHKINVGFGFAVTKACDINNDGYEDLAVSSHLANYGDLYAAGEVVVFYGEDGNYGWGDDNSFGSLEKTSISRVSDGLIQKADSMSQSLVCGDIDGDGFADVLAGGQNAGPELSGGGSQGMVVFFKGSSDGLEKNESWTLLPEVEEKAQYFGSSMILEDINGDEIQDLIVSGWGLKETTESDNTGGVYIYHGGTDWQNGPTLKVFGTKGSQFGSVIKLVKIGDQKLLGVIAPNEDKNGTIYFYDPATMTEKFTVKVPSTLNMGESGGFSDFDTIRDKDGNFILVAGGKYFKDGGRILCAKITSESVEELVECPWQPETTAGGFGSSVKNVGAIDSADDRDDLIIGMPEYIHTVTD